jgi:hypothetical protein
LDQLLAGINVVQTEQEIIDFTCKTSIYAGDLALKLLKSNN